jgi:hypothetical protein
MESEIFIGIDQSVNETYIKIGPKHD